jgi:hypothetical protein
LSGRWATPANWTDVAAELAFDGDQGRLRVDYEVDLGARLRPIGEDLPGQAARVNEVEALKNEPMFEEVTLLRRWKRTPMQSQEGVAHMHGQMDALLRFETAKPDPSREPAAAVASAASASDSASDPISVCYRLLPKAQEGDPGALSGLAASLGNPLLTLERDIGFEPTTFSLGMRSRGVGRGSSG